MANSVYVAAAEPHSGKILVSLGLMGLLERTIGRIGFFRPIARPYRPIGSSQLVADRDAWLVHEVFNLDVDLELMCGVPLDEAQAMLAQGREQALHERILDAYKRLEADVDFVLCEGTDYLSSTSAVESGFNVEVARDLNSPVVLVVDGSSGEPAAMEAKARIALDVFADKGCEVLAALFNRVPDKALPAASAALGAQLGPGGPLVGLLPHEPTLAMPRMEEVATHLGGRVLFGGEHLHKKVGRTVVASGSVETMIPLLDNDMLLVTHTDRHDAILMAMVSLLSRAAPNIGGVVLSGKNELAEPVQRLLEGLPGPRFPIVRSPTHTYETVLALTQVRTGLEPRYARELAVARQLFDSHVDLEALASAIQLSAPRQVTPKMFKHGLISQARADRRRIVLPEGDDERILAAADALLRLQAVDLTLLGDPEAVRAQAGQLGLDIAGAAVVDPQRCPEWHEAFAAVYQQARAKKGMTIEAARDAVVDPPVFGTLMVHAGHADGMVAGATTSTAATIRPAFQVIRTKRGHSLVSSVFFMCLADRVLVYGDCAVNPDPTAEQLAEIAVASAATAQAFGIEPRVAMLSYSTGESGQGADVDKVRQATRLARALRPDLPIEGPLQYDAAVDPAVARAKLPESTVGGRATVLIFPDLNTGNNTYKAVQRSAGAVAIGPVLQGLGKPVNDLSRGCLVEDIVNTVAITAIQAQSQGD